MTTKTFNRIAGYTLDQMILIVAIIAILVTIVILSVGWSIINRSSGAKLAAQFKQVEDANGQFYAANRVWPHQAYGSPTAANNMRALAGRVTFTTGLIPDENIKNFVPGFRDDNTNLLHNFGGAGGTITMDTRTGTQASPMFGNNVGEFLVVQFNGVPFSEVIEAEKAIDGGAAANADYTTGRVTSFDATGGDCFAGTPNATPTLGTGTPVTACYVANLIQ